MKIEFEMEPVTLKINGQEIVADPNKFHASWLARVIEYGTRRLPNDTHSGEQGATKEELVRKMIADMESGEPMPEKTRAAPKAKADPVRKMARDLATTFLAESLAKAMGKDAKVWAENPKTAHLFRLTEKGAVRFDLAAIDEWMEGYKAKRDFMADAQAALAKVEAKVDLGDLGL